MRLSKSYFKTLREVPAEAELKSHILLLRAGMIRKLASGVYGFMPMGLKALKKIEKIIRDEMDAEGCQEILMSALQPAELWKESGRWNAYGPEMWRVCDRHEREFCLGPTHEEVFTDIIRNDVDSHRKLPINLYQIQTKYRDEARPRFGLMRSREFIMKDSYSFDKDEEGLDISYENMYRCYENVFSRMELDVMPVEADTGAMGGNGSHEFIAKADAGESEIAFCSSCKMAATVERAACSKAEPDSDDELPVSKVHTPDKKTIEEVCEYLNKPMDKSIKAIFLKMIPSEGEEEFVVAFIRGDRQLNMIKTVNALGIAEHELVFADENEAAMDAPENRPSVKRATEESIPRPARAAVGCNISRMPGPPLGPSFTITTTSPSAMRPEEIASYAASSPSNTRAGPLWRIISGSTALCLTTEPSGAMFPYRIASPPSLWTGLSSGLMTSSS